MAKHKGQSRSSANKNRGGREVVKSGTISFTHDEIPSVSGTVPAVDFSQALLRGNPAAETGGTGDEATRRTQPC